MQSSSSPDRALLIFNPISGLPDDSPQQLMQLITRLQAQQIQPEVVFVEPELDLAPVIDRALQRGTDLFLASGGDGTVNTVAASLAGTGATLGIIPTGTQNNVALSLGIPEDVASAVDIVRHGRRVAVDMGMASCETARRMFLEVCSVGLLSALFPAADEIQRGRLGAIGDFFATLVASPPATMQLVLDSQQEIEAYGHVVLAANMPFIGPHYPIAAPGSFQDGLLDVFLFANLSKLGLIGAAVQVASGDMDDPRIHHYQVRELQVTTQPAMPILADGFQLGECPLKITIQPQTLSIMVPAA